MYTSIMEDYMATMRAMARADALAKIARREALDAKIGRRIAEKSRQRILAQRARAAYARYQQQQSRRR